MSEMSPAESSADGEPSRWQRAGDLFARWRDGDGRAMDELVRLMTPSLWHIVRAYGLDRARAEDVVQTAWLTLVRKHESITDPRAVAGWLATCARREAWRTGKAERRVEASDEQALDVRMPAHESAEQTVARSDGDARLWRAFGRLNERCRRLLQVIAFDQRPDYARLAGELSMPVGSIGPTRGRCLGKLRSALEAEGVGTGES